MRHSYPIRKRTTFPNSRSKETNTWCKWQNKKNHSSCWWTESNSSRFLAKCILKEACIFLQESSGSGHFSGIIDNLVIDNTRYNLWNPKRVNGDGRLYAPLRYKTLFYPADGKAASFYGNGYIQHAPGQFNSSLGFAAVELDFRTLQQNGIIIAILNKQQRYHFVIYLHNGHVNFYFQPDQNNGITLQSTRSSILTSF